LRSHFYNADVICDIGMYILVAREIWRGTISHHEREV